MSTIRAKVASILNAHQAAINAGSKQGVAVGDIATVVRLTDIVDPDTKQVLGQVQTPVVKLRVAIVDTAFCIANTFEPSVQSESDLLAMFTRGPQSDPVQQISELADPVGRAITVRVGSGVLVERPTPAKAPAPRPQAKPEGA
jgi:hypothetical protein